MIQPHASGNVTMVGIGIKLEEASGDGGGVRESQRSSPLCDWSSRLPAERCDPEKMTTRSTQSPLVRDDQLWYFISVNMNVFKRGSPCFFASP